MIAFINIHILKNCHVPGISELILLCHHKSIFRTALRVQYSYTIKDDGYTIITLYYGINTNAQLYCLKEINLKLKKYDQAISQCICKWQNLNKLTILLDG